MKDRKEEIENILHSLDGLKPVSANPFLYEKIRNRMQSRHAAVSEPFARWAFALAFILILNVITWTQLKTNDSNNANANPIAAQMGFTNNTYQY